MRAQAAQSVILEGDAVARGRAQALLAPDMAEAVRAAVGDRVAAARHQLQRPAVRRWLDAQRHFTEREAPAAFDELRGILLPAGERGTPGALGAAADKIADRPVVP